jgi:probable DNA metabolism protein
MLADDTVHALNKAVQHLKREAHRYKGFVRFSVYGDVMAAVIKPENQVLPLIMDHFCDRFGREAFMIYDQTHRTALIHQPCESKIIPIDELTLPETNAEEEGFRRMWRRFYETAAVEGRVNLRLRMAHMPKKYWSRLTEMAGETEKDWSLTKEQAGTKGADLLPRSIKE